MPEVELLGLNRLNIEGVVYHKGVKTPVDFDTAFSLKKNKRFKVTGLDTREALDYQDMQTRPRGADLHAAISAAIDQLDEDNDEHFDRVGKPAVGALAEILGYPITKEERDAAMSAVARAPQATRVTSASEVKAAVEARTAEGRSTVTLPKRVKSADEPAEQRVPV